MPVEGKRPLGPVLFISASDVNVFNWGVSTLHTLFAFCASDVLGCFGKKLLKNGIRTNAIN